MEIETNYDEKDPDNCEKMNVSQEPLEEQTEVKDDVLDLTIHCEPTLIEEGDYEEEESNFNDSLGLDEDCVDPLEFLEVDQASVPEEDVDYPVEEENNGAIDSTVKENNEYTDSVEAEQNEDINLKNNNGEYTNMGSGNLLNELLSAENICEKCGYLKNITDTANPQSDESRDFEDDETKALLCMCGSDKFKCSVCQIVLEQSCYVSHMQEHKPVRTHGYETRGTKSPGPDYQPNITKTSERPKTNTCNLCNKTFEVYKSLRTHQLSCGKKKIYQCNDCGESFPLKRAYFDHMKTHIKREQESFNCEICCIVFDSSSSKKEHIMRVHVEAQRFVCGTCGEAFVTECAMKRHCKTHIRNFLCKICGEKFSSRRRLLSHRVEHRALKGLRCNTCEREFEQITSYTEHKLTQCGTSEEKSTCELCNKSFKDKTALKKHNLVHIPMSERSVLCSICQRSFCGNSALQKHMRLIHANSRPYTCEFCSKSFNQLCKLKYHIVIHASDKPVSCDICSKAFSSEKDVKIHMRTHTGEKPFKCNLCEKTFRQRGHVKTHQLVHTKEKPFNCPVCEKSFGLSSSLKKHMKLHFNNFKVTSM